MAFLYKTGLLWLSLGFCVAAAAAAQGGAGTRAWHFRVLLDGKTIGSHDFAVTPTADGDEITSRAKFLVTVLNVPVYRYEHEDHEHWEHGCLTELKAHTRENGHASAVQAMTTPEGLKVSGPSGVKVWPGCVRTFAYWDPRALLTQRLLNAQTGDYETVQVTRDSQVGEVTAATDHYRLQSVHFEIQLWYDAQGAWLALESKTPQGRILRYELVSAQVCAGASC